MCQEQVLVQCGGGAVWGQGDKRLRTSLAVELGGLVGDWLSASEDPSQAFLSPLAGREAGILSFKRCRPLLLGAHDGPYGL